MKIKLRDANHLNAILSQTVNLPIVQDIKGEYCVFSTDKDEGGYFRYSGVFYKTIQEATKNIGMLGEFTKEALDKFIKEDGLNNKIINNFEDYFLPFKKLINREKK